MDPGYDPHFTAPQPLEKSPCDLVESSSIYVQQDNSFLNGGVRKLGIDEVLHFLGFMHDDIDIELQLAPVATSKRIPTLIVVEAAKSLAIWAVYYYHWIHPKAGHPLMTDQIQCRRISQ